MTDMDETAVEAVARAIKAAWDDQQQSEADASNGWFDYEPGTWEEWIPEARAAIAANPATARVAKLEEALGKIATIEPLGYGMAHVIYGRAAYDIAVQALASGESA